MTRFSPKIEIINHFDELINKVEIDIEQSMAKYNGNESLLELKRSEADIMNYWKKHRCNIFDLEFHEKLENCQRNIYLWCESIKIIEYLNRVRIITIEKLKKEQEKSLENYRLLSSSLKSELTAVNTIDELRSKLYSDKYYFKVHFTQSDKRLWVLNTYIFETNFYISQFEIDLLEKLINAEKEPFCPVNSPVFDEVTFKTNKMPLKINHSKCLYIFKKMVLIGLLYKKFIDNMLSFPQHVIQVRKQEVKDIRSIYFKHHYSRVNLTGSTIDLTRLNTLFLVRKISTHSRESLEVNIEGLSSIKRLHLGFNANETSISLRNLNSLKTFELNTPITVDENFAANIFDQLPNIEEITLYGTFSYFNLDNLVNLKRFYLQGTTNESFNFELFKSLCNQLEDLCFCKFDDETLFKLFDGRHFPNLLRLCYIRCNHKKINKAFLNQLNQFPMLREFRMNHCNLEQIEDGVFSNMKNLVRLDLSNNLLETIDKQTFLELVNLKDLILSKNRIKFIEKNMFSKLKNLKTIDLSNNRLSLLDQQSLIVLSDFIEIRLENNNAE